MKENCYKDNKKSIQKTNIKNDIIIIEKGPHYNGLLGISGTYSLEFLPNCSLYNFPLLSSSESKKQFPLTSFTLINNQDIFSMFAKYYNKSPFHLASIQETDSSINNFQEAPKNSMNFCSFYSQALSQNSNMLSENSLIADSTKLKSSISSCHSIIEKQQISNSQKDAIIKIHTDFTKNLTDERNFQSISPRDSFSPRDSLSPREYISCNESGSELTPPSAREFDFDSHSSISPCYSREIALTSLNLELSMLEWDIKRKNIRNQVVLNNSNNVCLIGESEEIDSKYLFQSKDALMTAQAIDTLQSIDSPPEDEGTIRMSIANRLFLNGNTASKHRLSNENSYKIQQVPQKILQESQTLYLESYRMCPYGISPLLRKLVIYEESRQILSENRHCQIIYSCPIGGFISTPSLKYYNKPNKSYTHIPSDSHPIPNMLSLPILKDIMGISIKYISCGYEHIVALTINGKLYSWGLGKSGCLGHNNLNNYSLPELINSAKNNNYLMIECGGYHTLALSDEGEVWSWGRNDVGQCGINKINLYKDHVGCVVLEPVKIKDLVGICGISCGEAHSLFLNNNGQIFGCGWADEGQLGKITVKDKIFSISIFEKITKIKCGGIFSIALSENGKIYVWGNGDYGELGLGMNVKFSENPMLVESLSSEYIVDIACGESHVLAITSEKIYGWGRGIVENLADSFRYPPGSDIICYAPVLLKEINCIQRVLIPKNDLVFDFTKILEEKLQKIQDI